MIRTTGCTIKIYVSYFGSHRKIYPKRAMARVKQFYLPLNEFMFVLTNKFDHNSEKNSIRLKSEANDLQNPAIS
jgi:hypothetical protein